MIAGIILAAGASSRMGSPKALLQYRGETFVSRLVRLFSGPCSPVIVALGYHASAILPELADSSSLVALNPAPERGQFSSLQTALQMVPPDAEGFLFAPVDCPAFKPETLAQIVFTFEQREKGMQLVVPRFLGRRGHPVCAARSLVDEMLALPPLETARQIIRSHVNETVYLDVDDPGVLTDVDDPEAYRQLTLLL